MKKPTLIIFAGANGAGKTTVARLLLPKLKIREFVNADEIARGLSPLNPAGQAMRAGRLVLERIDGLIAQGESFAIETTLSGLSQVKKIEAAKEAGFKIELYYMFCRDINLNIRRVKLRAKQGGHDVPAADVRRRYRRSLYNLDNAYSSLCDKMYLYDTTGHRLVRFARCPDVHHIDVYDHDLLVLFMNALEGAKGERR